MLRTLYAKLSFTLIALLLIVGVFYTLLSLSSISHYMQETGQKLNLDLAKNLVMDRNLVKEGKLNNDALKATFMEYMVINPSIELYLLDANGQILSYSADPGKVKRKSVSLKPINAFLNGQRLPLMGDDPRSHDKQKIFSVTPIPDTENPEGYLYIVLLGEQYDQAEQMIRQSLLWRQTGWALIGSLSFGLVLGLMLFRHLTRRLNKLSRNMDQFDINQFKQQTFTDEFSPNGDEIERLNYTFQKMATRLNEQMVQLKQQDNQRRELVANVSHDLRTPVAILHGYLETLGIKANTLTEEERNNYIHQALQSSVRLNQLINELFELAKLEAHETVPRKESFNLTELAYDVVQKFQLKAAQKEIRLNLHAEDTAIFVDADIALIARVFENLIGNAIKFTPQGKTIDIHLASDGELIITKVKDAGPGIAADDLPKIFDRFYQGEENSNRATPGGLGLAIAKRILELHQGTIGVVSQLGDGAEFSFSLPRVC